MRRLLTILAHAFNQISLLTAQFAIVLAKIILQLVVTEEAVE